MSPAIKSWSSHDSSQRFEVSLMWAVVLDSELMCYLEIHRGNKDQRIIVPFKDLLNQLSSLPKHRQEDLASLLQELTRLSFIRRPSPSMTTSNAVTESIGSDKPRRSDTDTSSAERPSTWRSIND